MSTRPTAPKPMPMWQIIAILATVGVVVGISLGLLGEAFNFGTAWSGMAVGGAVGIVGALLMSRRQKALKAKNDE